MKDAWHSKSEMACPLCGCLATSSIREVATTELVETWKKSLKIDVGACFSHLTVICLRCCLNCHLRFFAPSVLGDGFFYDELSKRSACYYRKTKWEYAAALDVLKPLRSILEIGCGYGYFIDQLHEGGCSDVMGIDLNGAVVQECQSRGVPVKELSWEGLRAEPYGRFSAIVAFQVIEHFAAPGLFLKTCHDQLAPDGLLVLAVPNRLRYRGLDQVNVYDYPPHHQTQWGCDVFEWLGRTPEWRVVELHREPLDHEQAARFVALLADRQRWIPYASWLWRQFAERVVLPCLKHTAVRHLVSGHTLLAVLKKI